MGIRDLKKELKKLDKDGLINLISDLYKKDKAKKEFLDFYVEPNERELFHKYQDIVFEAFYPVHGYQLKLKHGKRQFQILKNSTLHQNL